MWRARAASAWSGALRLHLCNTGGGRLLRWGGGGGAGALRKWRRLSYSTGGTKTFRPARRLSVTVRFSFPRSNVFSMCAPHGLRTRGRA
eukprot:639371-Prorocentrum_minimum.AAC.4